MNYEEFLYEHFGTKPNDAFINIWTLPLKRSNFFNDLDKASALLKQIKDNPVDIYFGPGMLGKNLGRTKRGKKEDIIGISSYYMDVDLKTKDKPKCPPTVKDALSLIEGYGFDPSIVVHTGNGLHIYWLFKEVWMFKNGEMQKFEDLNSRLQQTIKGRAQEKGWELDATADSTRVLRMVDTKNWKDKKNPKDSRVLKANSIRYSDPEEVEEFIIQPDPNSCIRPTSTGLEQIKVADDLILDPLAEPNSILHDGLQEIDPRYKITWQHKREDLADSSPSGYAMSLACIAAMAEWPDQEIANLIIAFYRRHKLGLDKAMRPDYIARTISKARQFVDQQIEKDYIENVQPAVGTKYENIVDPGGDKSINYVQSKLKLNIKKIEQYKQEKDSYWLIYSSIYRNGKAVDEIIPFEGRAQFTDQKKFTQIVYEKTGHWISLDAKTFRECLRHFTKLIVMIEPGPQTAAARIALWLTEYLDGKKPIPKEESVKDREPFVYKNYWYVYAKKLDSWAWQKYGKTTSLNITVRDLKIVKAKQERFDLKNPNTNRRKTMRPYKIPHSIIIPPKVQDNEDD